MAKISEMDLAVAGVLRMIDQACEGVPVGQRKVLFALGNETFRSGFNLSLVHTTFLRRLLQQVRKAKKFAKGMVASCCFDFAHS